jgi:hypothetical protein
MDKNILFIDQKFGIFGTFLGGFSSLNSTNFGKLHQISDTTKLFKFKFKFFKKKLILIPHPLK